MLLGPRLTVVLIRTLPQRFRYLIHLISDGRRAGSTLVSSRKKFQREINDTSAASAGLSIPGVVGFSTEYEHTFKGLSVRNTEILSTSISCHKDFAGLGKG